MSNPAVVAELKGIQVIKRNHSADYGDWLNRTVRVRAFRHDTIDIHVSLPSGSGNADYHLRLNNDEALQLEQALVKIRKEKEQKRQNDLKQAIVDLMIKLESKESE